MNPKPIEEAASREKALAAEKYIANVRAAVIALNVIVYLFLMDWAGTYPRLAYFVIGIAVPYAVLVVTYKPYRRFPVLTSAWFTSFTDATLIVLWITATGGFESPFLILWYVSIAAIAFRFDFRTTILVAAWYSVLHLGVLAALGELVGHVAAVVVQVFYIFFVAMIGGYVTRETFEQTHAKLQLREKETRLQESLSLLNATLDSTADGILVVDRENRIVSYNAKFAQMWGIPNEVLESRNDQKAIEYVLGQLKNPEAFVQQVRELYADPLAQRFDALEFRDGRVFERYSQSQMMGGKPVGRVWSFRDVTTQRRAERANLENVERSKELERLKELDDFKTRFVNSIAHELWTPLTPIRVQLHLLRNEKRGQLGPEQARAIEMIDRNMDRLQHLIEEMLDGARLQAGAFRVARAPMDFRAVLEEVVELFRPTSV